MGGGPEVEDGSAGPGNPGRCNGSPGMPDFFKNSLRRNPSTSIIATLLSTNALVAFMLTRAIIMGMSILSFIFIIIMSGISILSCIMPISMSATNGINAILSSDCLSFNND